MQVITLPVTAVLFLYFLCRDVFPQGLPDEYAFVTTFKFRKTSRREDWYLWQIFDKYGIPQVINNTFTQSSLQTYDGRVFPMVALT